MAYLKYMISDNPSINRAKRLAAGWITTHNYPVVDGISIEGITIVEIVSIVDGVIRSAIDTPDARVCLWVILRELNAHKMLSLLYDTGDGRYYFPNKRGINHYPMDSRMHKDIQIAIKVYLKQLGLLPYQMEMLDRLTRRGTKVV